MAEIYKVVAIDDDGRKLESYAMPNTYRFFARSMMEEYGNVEVTPMQLDELPEEILEQVKQTNVAAGEQEAD